MDDKDKIIEGLRAELERAKERERDAIESRRAVLNIMEEANEINESLVRAKKEWEATFDAIPDPIFIHDKNLRIMRANRAYQALAAKPFKDIVGRLYYEVFPVMDRPFEVCTRRADLREEGATVKEEIVTLPETGKIFKVRFYTVRDADGAYQYSVHHLEDITEARKAEDRIRVEVERTSNLLMIAETTAKVTDMERLCADVNSCLHKLVGSDICLFYLYDKERRLFTPASEIGLATGRVPIFRTEPLHESAEFVKTALKERRPVMERTTGVSRAYLPRFMANANNDTILTAPLLGKKGPLGVLLAVFSDKKELMEREMKVVEGALYQVSAAIEEAAAYRESINRTMELSRKIETIQAMNEIDRSILSTLSRDEILETVTMLVSNVIACDRATVALADREKGGFTYAAGFGCDFATKGTVIPFCDTSATEVLEMGRPEYVQNLMMVEDIRPLEKKFLDAGFLSHIRVPLVVKGEAVGVLTVGAKRASAFTSEDLATLENLAFQISVALENARLISDLEELFLGTIKTLSSAIDAKSPWTAGHSERVTAIAMNIGEKMSLAEKELKDIEIAGLLHDIGKLATYEEILNKPGKLTEEEIAMMRQHPGKGAEILASIKQLKDVALVVRHHHEAYDGNGYPAGLKGEAIPLLARVLAVADTVDAMGADRPYRKGKLADAIAAELKRCSGTQFDPKVVEAYLREGLGGAQVNLE
jgi:putative nucleotidyltransferase with HDIG domain/PAS domain S-box-containing protein